MNTSPQKNEVSQGKTREGVLVNAIVETDKENPDIVHYICDTTIISVNERFCKNCRICVDFCPVHCLTLGRNSVYVNDVTICTQCMLCEMRCPDFAIWVDVLKKWKKKK